MDIKKSKNYLLVHGAYHGAWCWDEIKGDLIMRGHKVFTIDLPGHGDDKTPRDKVNLEAYVVAVKNYIIDNDLLDLIIVGHSFGGIVISKIIDLVPERISGMIFITAMVLDDGERFFDYFPEEVETKYRELATLSKDKSIKINKNIFRNKLANKCMDQNAFDIFFNKLSPQPIGPYEDKVYLKNLKHCGIPITYIKCLEDISLSEESFKNILKRLPINSKIVNLYADHEVFLSNPKELATILSKI
jgi:pimeloyl-ACP methyl ester carboxylesterase